MRRTVFAAALLLAAALLAGCSDGDDTNAGGAPTTGALTEPLGELPTPRTEMAGAAWLGTLVVGGGLTLDNAASDLVHTYDAAGARWVAAPKLPVPLHHAGMATLGGRVYVAGGYTNGPGQPWVPQAGVYSLGEGEDQWRDEPPMPAGARGALGLAAAGGRLVAAGGESGGQALKTTEVFDPSTRQWTKGPDLAVAREHLAVATRGDRVFAIAGRTATAGNLTDVESFDPVAGRAWNREPAVQHSRGGIGADSVDGRLCVAGGEEAAGTIASVECLDGDAWADAGILARPRHGLAVIALGPRLHVVGGGEQPGLFVSGAHEALDLE